MSLCSRVWMVLTPRWRGSQRRGLAPIDANHAGVVVRLQAFLKAMACSSEHIFVSTSREVAQYVRTMRPVAWFTLANGS